MKKLPLDIWNSFTSFQRKVMLVAFFIFLIAVVAVAYFGSLPSEHQACYIIDANNDWAVFQPHWEDGEAIYAVSLSENSSSAFTVQRSAAMGQWETLAEDAPLVAAVMDFTNGTWKIEVYSLDRNRQVAEFRFGYATQILRFNSEVMIVHDLGGAETTPRWFRVNVADWSVEEIESSIHPPSIRRLVPLSVEERIHASAPFCRSWPGMAANPTATP